MTCTMVSPTASVTESVAPTTNVYRAVVSRSSIDVKVIFPETESI